MGIWGLGDLGTWGLGDWGTGRFGDWETGIWGLGDWDLGTWRLGDWDLGTWRLGDWEIWGLGDWDLGTWRLGENFETANLLDDVGNASVSVLTKLGYDCKTASAGAILCTKCKADGFKKKCEAFTCDVATKKCRRKTADLPNIPGLGNDDDAEDNDGVKLPSL